MKRIILSIVAVLTISTIALAVFPATNGNVTGQVESISTCRPDQVFFTLTEHAETFYFPTTVLGKERLSQLMYAESHGKTITIYATNYDMVTLCNGTTGYQFTAMTINP